MITVDVQIPDTLRRALSPARTEEAARRTLEYCAIEVRKLARAYPGASNSPVIWTSEKQRRYYFAMRREQGLPIKYTRSNELRKAWAVQRRSNREYAVENRSPYAVYVMGNRQQFQHTATAWKTDRWIADEFTSRGIVQRFF